MAFIAGKADRQRQTEAHTERRRERQADTERQKDRQRETCLKHPHLRQMPFSCQHASDLATPTYLSSSRLYYYDDTRNYDLFKQDFYIIIYRNTKYNVL